MVSGMILKTNGLWHEQELLAEDQHAKCHLEFLMTLENASVNTRLLSKKQNIK